MPSFRHWRWHLNEMYVKLNGEMVYLWRAVDHEGEILESYITRTRNKEAALVFMKTAPSRCPARANVLLSCSTYLAMLSALRNRSAYSRA
jgi:transposase-like protein